MMIGTHSKKRLKHLFSSARKSDDEIYANYGADTAFIIEGKAGSGFIEDTSCFHRALAPIEDSRLALQIRYS